MLKLDLEKNEIYDRLKNPHAKSGGRLIKKAKY